MKVVVNATPLIALSLINQLELLNQLFEAAFQAPADLAPHSPKARPAQA